MKLLTFAFVLMISGFCLCEDEDDYLKKHNLLKCYTCLSDPLDGANATCRTDMTGVRHCHGTECNVLKIEFFGGDFFYRVCNGKSNTRDISQTIFSTKYGTVQRMGMKVSWSTCHENLCNSYNIGDSSVDSGTTGYTATWRTHALILFASVMLPLKYYNYFY